MYRNRRRKLRKNIIVSAIVLLVLGIALKIFYNNSRWSSLASDTLATNGILSTQAQNPQPKMDINSIQTSLENVLKQYQLLNSPANNMSKNQIVSELDRLYQISANDYTNVVSLNISSVNQQALDELIQGSNYLTASLFEKKDSLIFEGDFSTIQAKNSQDDLAIAVMSLSQAKQALHN